MDILLIDDDEDTNFLIDMLLSKCDWVDNYKVESSPLLALECLKKEQKFPDYIFVDLTMPEMDGYDFVDRFEKMHKGKLPDTSIYILSSSARATDRRKVDQYVSVKEFLLKPLTKQKLIEITRDKIPQPG